MCAESRPQTSAGQSIQVDCLTGKNSNLADQVHPWTAHGLVLSPRMGLANRGPTTYLLIRASYFQSSTGVNISYQQKPPLARLWRSTTAGRARRVASIYSWPIAYKASYVRMNSFPSETAIDAVISSPPIAFSDTISKSCPALTTVHTPSLPQ